MANERDWRVLRKGEALCLQGEEADALFILRQGAIDVYVASDAKPPVNAAAAVRDGRKVGTIEGAGAFAGESGLFLKRRTASLIVGSDRAEVERIASSEEGLRAVLRQRSGMCLTLCRTLARRLTEMDGRIRTVAAKARKVEKIRGDHAFGFARLVEALRPRAAGQPDLENYLDEMEDNPFWEYGRSLYDDRKKTSCFFQDGAVRQRSGTILLDTGSPLVQEGDLGRAFFYVQSGMLEASVGGQPLAQIGPQEVVGEVAVLLKEMPKRTATVRALRPSQLQCVPAAEFEALATEKPEILVAMASLLSRRLDATNHLLCQRSRHTDEACDGIAGDASYSCEAEFRRLVRLLDPHEALADLRERAGEMADRAVRDRQGLLLDEAETVE